MVSNNTIHTTTRNTKTATTSGNNRNGGGYYVVKEEGLVYEHNVDVRKNNNDRQQQQQQQQPTTPEIYLEQFRSNFCIRVLERPEPNHIVFELINIDVSFMNALRRILLSEIPTVALEHVYMWNNNSIIHDEVLAHRIGLIPFNIDARLLEDRNPITNNNNDTTATTGDNTNGDNGGGEETAPTDRNTVVFRLAVTCPSSDPNKNNNNQTSKNDHLTKHQHHAKKRTLKGGKHNIKQEEDNDTNVDVTAEDITMMQEESKISVLQEDGKKVGSNMVLSDEEIKYATKTAATNSNNKYQYPKDRPYTYHVYSKEFVWCPQGEQMELFQAAARAILGGNSNSNSNNSDENNNNNSDTIDDDAINQLLPRPIHDDILIAKLRPGQSIELEAHGQRGIGKDHAKYSPVATASYRMMPQIEIIQPIYDDNAKELVYIYEPGVFTLIPTDPMIDPPNTTVKAIVCNPYACTMSRNYMKNPILKQSILMKRISNHFILSIESIGMYSPSVLLAEAIKILQKKCLYIQDHIEEHILLKNDLV